MDGVEIYPSISLILFLTFFLLLIGYLIKTGKEPWEEASNLPLDTND